MLFTGTKLIHVRLINIYLCIHASKSVEVCKHIYYFQHYNILSILPVVCLAKRLWFISHSMFILYKCEANDR